MNEWKKWFSILLCLVMTLMMLVPTGISAQSPSRAGTQPKQGGPTQVLAPPPLSEGFVLPMLTEVELNTEGHWEQLSLIGGVVSTLAIDPSNSQILYAGTGLGF